MTKTAYDLSRQPYAAEEVEEESRRKVEAGLSSEERILKLRGITEKMLSHAVVLMPINDKSDPDDLEGGMHWSLLVVASSMGNKEGLRSLPRVLTSAISPPCDIFLAPSTISRSTSVRTAINK